MEDRVIARTADLDRVGRDLHNILDSVPAMIAYWDSNLINRFANAAKDNWFGVTPEWMKGRHIREVLTEEVYLESLPHIEAALRGERRNFERIMVDPQGGSHVGQVSYVPDVKDGHTLGFYALIFDITELKAAELAQKEAKEAALDATRAKSVFLTSMSHELRTPMNSVLGFSDLLFGGFAGKLNTKQAEYVGIVKSSGEHLLKLMDEVLELSKIEAKQVKLTIGPLNAVAAIRSAIASLETLADKHQVRLQAKSIGPDETYIAADMTRLSQILINLGSNAIKYNRPGGRVEFSTEHPSGDSLRIVVSDTGRGIPQDRQKGAFQPFNRLGAENGTVEGTGVGLALVRNLTEIMGGRIGFESVEGVGSRFWIDMPVASAQPPEVDPSIVAGESTVIPEIADGLKVLYVEDNANSRVLFRHMMAILKNVEVLDASDGQTGLAIARAQRPDIIFLDINLPGRSGYDVLRDLKADTQLSDVPVVALTANAMAGDAEYGLDQGLSEYLTKPVRLSRLIQIVSGLQNRRALASG